MAPRLPLLCSLIPTASLGEICSVLSPNHEPSCRVEKHGLTWWNGGIWRAVKSQSSNSPPVYSPCEPLVALRLGAMELSASGFRHVAANGTGWATTHEGEWCSEASLQSSNSQGTIFLGDWGHCSLASVCVYRPAPDKLTLRLNFGVCSGTEKSGYRAASVEFMVRKGDAAAAASPGLGLLDWMCALQTPSSCAGRPGTGPDSLLGRTLASKRLTVPASGSLDQGFPVDDLGQGRCDSALDVKPREHPLIKDWTECANICRRENIWSQEGCTGFAFSAESLPRCLVYRGEIRLAGGKEGGWLCFRMPTVRRLQAPEEQPLLRVAQALGSPAGLRALRWRIAPLAPGCFLPLAWVMMGFSPESSLAIPAADWDFLSLHLPVASGEAEVDGTLQSDWVCVQFGDSPLAKALHCGGEGTGEQPPGPPVALVYFVTVCASAAIGAGVAWAVLSHLRQRRPPKTSPKAGEKVEELRS